MAAPIPHTAPVRRDALMFGAWVRHAGLVPERRLLGAYATRGDADELAKRPLREQIEMSRAAIEGLHPGRGRELEKPMAVVWSNVPYLTVLASPRATMPASAANTLLNEPDAPFYFAREHLS
jgi:monoamine oxidase